MPDQDPIARLAAIGTVRAETFANDGGEFEEDE